MIDKRLIEEISRTAGRGITTSSDFDWLSEKIYERLHERISGTTLKRMFGYLKEPVTPRLSTLNALARFIGYRDYEHFCLRNGENGVQSHLVLQDSLRTEDLEVGQRLKLTWLPDRLCVISHLGEGRFKVEEVENTKLMEGDTFTAHLIINHEPLYLDHFLRNNEELPTYVVGRKDGVQFELL